MILYGHRGAKNEAPENTLPGFAHAYKQGARAFEMDVRLTRDHELVIMHDATVDRTTNGTGAVADLTRAELAGLDARAAFPDWPESCPVPTFAEFLAFLPDDVLHMEVEIKRDAPDRLEILCPKLVEQINASRFAERIIVTSFDPHALGIMRRIAPGIQRGFIARYDTPADIDTALELGCVRAGINVTTGLSEQVKRAHDNGISVTGWPGNEIAHLEKSIEWQAEAITSDVPGFSIPFLRERGLL